MAAVIIHLLNCLCVVCFMWYALSLIKKQDKRITYLKRTIDYLIQVAELEQKQVKKLTELDELRGVQIGSLCDCFKKIMNAKGINDEKHW